MIWSRPRSPSGLRTSESQWRPRPRRRARRSPMRRQALKQRQTPTFRCSEHRGADEMGSWVEKRGGVGTAPRTDDAVPQDDQAVRQDGEAVPQDGEAVPAVGEAVPADDDQVVLADDLVVIVAEDDQDATATADEGETADGDSQPDPAPVPAGALAAAEVPPNIPAHD